MEIIANLGLGFETAFTLANLFYCLLGVFVGTAVGVLALGALTSAGRVLLDDGPGHAAKALADATEGVTFVGRLATYRYYNMDQVVGQALATYRRHVEKRDADDVLEVEAAE